MELFFSRRIGVAEDGQVVPILAGARLSGKVASTNVGFLNMQTDELAGVTQSNNFTVVRASRELPNRSSIGAIFVNRQGTGDLAPENDHNRTFGLDGRVGFGEYGRVEGYVAGTSTSEMVPSPPNTTTSDLSGSAHAYQAEVAHESPSLDLSLAYTEVGENFNPEVGFLERPSGYRNVQVQVFSRLRLEHPKILELRPHASYRGWWNLEDGFRQSDFIHFDNHVEWRSGFVFESALNLVREGVEEDFEIADGVVVPAGNYESKEADFTILTNQGAWISFDTDFIAGGFFGGEKVTLTPALRMRLGETFNAALSLAYNNIDLPGGIFTTNLAQARLSYSFNPKTALQALIQYNDRADLWSANLRFSWLESGNNGLFLVFNTTRQLGSFSSVEPNRSLILKYSRVFDLLH